MSAILPHMCGLLCEFKMQVWNVLHAARWKCRTQKIVKNLPSRTIAQLCRAISLQLRHVSTIGKTVKQQYLLHMSSQYGELRPTGGWDRSGSFLAPQLISTAFASWQRYCTALEQRARAKLCGVEHRAPPIFGRATITLGIGPHSSFIKIFIICCRCTLRRLLSWQHCTATKVLKTTSPGSRVWCKDTEK